MLSIFQRTQDARLNDDQKKPALRQMGIYMTLPFVLAVPPILGYWLGYFFDWVFSTEPYISYILLVLGFSAGVLEFRRIIKKFGTE